MTEQRDQEYLQRAQSGEPQALVELYDRFSPLMFALALRIVGGAAEAEDALEAAWLHVWRRAAIYDARRGTVAAWLASIVRARALERRRGAGPRPPASPPQPGGAFSGGAGEAVAGLDSRQREVLELAYFEGLTETDIAQRLGVGTDAVRSWTHEGLIQLRDQLPQGDWL